MNMEEKRGETVPLSLSDRCLSGVGQAAFIIDERNRAWRSRCPSPHDEVEIIVSGTRRKTTEEQTIIEFAHEDAGDGSG